jgi:Cu(I)/Ag(I) efflux system membrane protein CusA/SilA
MIGRVVSWCTSHSPVVLAIALVLAAGGEWARRSLSKDAVPDLSDPQIGLVAEWMGHPAAEVASQVTGPLTESLKSIAGVTSVRGASMAGMAYVDVLFASPHRLGSGRSEIERRVADLRLRWSPSVRLEVGPPASATGWIYQYAIVGSSGKPLSVGRFVQDEFIRPALEAIPGVAEVASVGETSEQVLVETNAEQLRARALSFSDLVAALRPAVHGSPDIKSLESLPLRVTRAGHQAELQVGDVAHATVATDMPIGIADLNGDTTTAGGIVVARRDADPQKIIPEVTRKLRELEASLAPRVKLVTVYSRLDLARRVEHTLLRALGEEILVVVLVILLFLLHARSALAPLLTLPLVLLLTFAGMYLLRIPATIMSLGGIGIALGMAVDADVVALEAAHRRLEGLGKIPSPNERRLALVRAAGTIAPAVLTSLLITALSFLPVLAFTGETGRLLRPLAISKTLVILAAAVVAITLAPALREGLLRGPIPPEFSNPITGRLVRLYRPFVHFALSRPTLTLITAALAVASCLPVVGRLGREFLPRVDEGDLLFMPTTLPGISAGDAAVQLRRMDGVLAKFPEVLTVFGKVGRANTATDPAPFSMIETTIRLRPRSEWPKVACTRWYSQRAPAWLKSILAPLWPEERLETTAELVEKLDRATRMPGWASAWTAPARARMDMMSTGGVRTPVGIRIVAANPERLGTVGAALQSWASALPGTRSAVFESLGGEPWLKLELDPDALTRHQVDPDLALSTAALVISGGQLGELAWQGPATSTWRPKRFIVGHGGRHHGQGFVPPSRQPYRLRVAADMGMKAPGADQLREVTVSSAEGRPVPLALLGHPRYETVPAALRSENGELVAYVYVDLKEGIDVGSYVAQAQRRLGRAMDAGKIELDAGERIEWTGQYQLLAAGEQRLKWILPLVALSMLALLFLQFRSLTQALIVLVSVPFALVGSFWSLFLLRYPLSAPVWVGLLSAVGLAMQTGVVMVVYIDEAFHRRVREGKIRTRDDIVAAHAEGTIARLRPKIMTVTTMAAGLLPLLWAQGSGAEIMKRVAAPMLGGLVTSAFLTLEVLPVIYTIWRTHQLRRAQRLNRELGTILGKVPPWAV